MLQPQIFLSHTSLHMHAKMSTEIVLSNLWGSSQMRGPLYIGPTNSVSLVMGSSTMVPLILGSPKRSTLYTPVYCLSRPYIPFKHRPSRISMRLWAAWHARFSQRARRISPWRSTYTQAATIQRGLTLNLNPKS